MASFSNGINPCRRTGAAIMQITYEGRSRSELSIKGCCHDAYMTWLMLCCAFVVSFVHACVVSSFLASTSHTPCVMISRIARATSSTYVRPAHACPRLLAERVHQIAPQIDRCCLVRIHSLQVVNEAAASPNSAHPMDNRVGDRLVWFTRLTSGATGGRPTGLPGIRGAVRALLHGLRRLSCCPGGLRLRQSSGRRSRGGSNRRLSCCPGGPRLRQSSGRRSRGGSNRVLRWRASIEASRGGDRASRGPLQTLPFHACCQHLSRTNVQLHLAVPTPVNPIV